jgi:hypothetical protein
MLVPSASSTSSSRRFRVARSSASRLATEVNESVRSVMNAVPVWMSSRSMVPHRRSTSALSAPRFLGSGSLSSFGTLTHGLPCRVTIRTPPLVPLARAVSSRVSASARRLFRLGGVQGLAQLGVVDVAVVLEVARQVLVRVLPASGTLDVDLAAAQRVPQRDQHAQLLGDALDPAVVVDDAVQPRLRHDPVDGTLSPAA